MYATSIKIRENVRYCVGDYKILKIFNPLFKYPTGETSLAGKSFQGLVKSTYLPKALMLF